MRKLGYAVAVGLATLALSTPAKAAWGELDQYGCAYDHAGFYHCYQNGGGRVFRTQREMFSWTSGQDVNSNKDLDGSVRFTPPPHNSRGTERPSTETEENFILLM